VAIVQEGALPSLIALLSSTDERIQEQAAVSLRNLSVNPQNEIQIVQDGGLRPLIALLRSANEKVVRQAAGALANVTVNPKNKIKLVQASGLGPLVALLKHADDKVSFFLLSKTLQPSDIRLLSDQGTCRWRDTQCIHEPRAGR